jgi:hypothetical protein
VSRNSLKFVIGLSQQSGKSRRVVVAILPQLAFCSRNRASQVFAVPVTVNLPMRMCSSYLHVHDPEELTFVEQDPITIGGPADLTQTAFPTGADLKPSDVLGSVIGGLFVLSKLMSSGASCRFPTV